MAIYCSNPISWFWDRSGSLAFLNTTNSCWPFLNITKAEFIEISAPLASLTVLHFVDPLLDFIFLPIGVFGSICSIVAVWHKAVKKRDHFYIWMLWIGVMDLLFNSCRMYTVLGTGWLFESLFKNSFLGMELVCIFFGLVAAFSFAADMCTLVLAFERFLGICKPTSVQGGRSLKFHLLTSVCVVLISCIRFIKYGLDANAVESQFSDNSTQKTYILQGSRLSKTKFFDIIGYISDLALPFLLSIPMVYLSARIGIAVIRRKTNVQALTKSTANEAKEATTKTMLQLLAVLVALFLLNQIGYCLFAILFFVKMFTSISFQSDPSEMKAYVGVILFQESALFYFILAEDFARAAGFFFYYIFSSSVRGDFKRAVSSVVGAFGRIIFSLES